MFLPQLTISNNTLSNSNKLYCKHIVLSNGKQTYNGYYITDRGIPDESRLANMNHDNINLIFVSADPMNLECVYGVNRLLHFVENNLNNKVCCYL